MKYFRIFGSKCSIRTDGENLGEFDTRDNEGILLGYSTKSKAYNKRLRRIVERTNVKVDEDTSKRIVVEIRYEFDESTSKLEEEKDEEIEV